MKKIIAAIAAVIGLLLAALALLASRSKHLSSTRVAAAMHPVFVAGLPIFSRAYYAKRPFEESTLDIPLGSGAYRVGKFEAGRFIEYQRVADWWGADLPALRGQNNFDTLRYEYYRDRDVGFEGFTGKTYPFREEFT